MFINEKNKSLIALFVSALFFGSTFLIVKNLLSIFSPTFIVFLRYIIAAFFFAVIGGMPEKRTWKPGLMMGLFLWLGYITQTQGLLTTSTINSGVVTGFYVVLTPFLSKFINKTDLEAKNYIYSFLGFTGIALISINDISQVFGNLFTLICAVAYAMHIVLVERYVKNQNISQLMFVQSLTGAVLCIPLITVSEFEFLYENGGLRVCWSRPAGCFASNETGGAGCRIVPREGPLGGWGVGCYRGWAPRRFEWF